MTYRARPSPRLTPALSPPPRPRGIPHNEFVRAARAPINAPRRTTAWHALSHQRHATRFGHVLWVLIGAAHPRSNDGLPHLAGVRNLFLFGAKRLPARLAVERYAGRRARLVGGAPAAAARRAFLRKSSSISAAALKRILPARRPPRARPALVGCAARREGEREKLDIRFAAGTLLAVAPAPAPLDGGEPAAATALPCLPRQHRGGALTSRRGDDERSTS